MADIYEEMRKRALLENAANPQDRIKETQLAERNASLGDAAVAAVPTLMNLLGKGSSIEQANRITDANKYLQNRGAANAAELKDIKTISNEIGEPEFIKAEDSIGMKAYEAPKAGKTAADLAGHVHSAQKVFNVDTAERGLKVLYKNGTSKIINSTGEESTGGKWEPDLGVGVVTSEDMYGSKKTKQWNKNTPTGDKKIVTQQPGYGSTQGVPTEGIKQAEKSLDEHNKRIGDLELKRSDLQSSLSIMSNPNATPTELTAARESLIRSISTEPRLTDNDVARAMGNDFRSLYAQLRNSISNKAYGDMSPEQRSEFLKSAKTLISKIDSGIGRSHQKMMEESSTVPGGKNYLEKKTKTQVQKSKAKQAELIEMKNKAKKFFGNNVDAYNKFIAKKQEELGI